MTTAAPSTSVSGLDTEEIVIALNERLMKERFSALNLSVSNSFMLNIFTALIPPTVS